MQNCNCRGCGSEQRLVVTATDRAECPACGAVYMFNFHGKFIVVDELTVARAVLPAVAKKKRRAGRRKPSKKPDVVPARPAVTKKKRRAKRKVVQRKRAPGSRRKEREQEERTARRARKPKRRRAASGTDSLDTKFSGLEGLVTGDYGKSHFE